MDDCAGFRKQWPARTLQLPRHGTCGKGFQAKVLISSFEPTESKKRFEFNLQDTHTVAEGPPDDEPVWMLGTGYSFRIWWRTEMLLGNDSSERFPVRSCQNASAIKLSAHEGTRWGCMRYSTICTFHRPSNRKTGARRLEYDFICWRENEEMSVGCGQR